MNTKFLLSLASGASLLVLASAANAALINDGGLTLDTDPSAIYQQTSASPCVIGGNNCQNPVGFAFTDAPTGGSGSVTRTSPTYDVADIIALVGNTFTIGLDYNQTSVAQTLFLFTADYDTGTDQTFDLTTVLQTNNNGVGFSDFLLSGFVIPNGATTVTFTATWFQNDGADRYFLIGENTPVFVPEPSTLAVLGMGLLGLGVLARRRKA